MHAAPPLQTCSAPQACTTAAWGLLALLQLPLSAVPVYIVYTIVHTCYNLRAATTCALLLHHCCATAWSRATLVAPLASSPWNLPTQASAHPLCVPTAHTLVGLLKLAVCPLLNHYVVSCSTQLSWHHSLPCRGTRPLKHLHTHSMCQLRTLS